MHRNINKVKLICKGNMSRSLFLSTMGTFLLAFNCDRGINDFRAKAIQNRLHPDLKLLNNPSADYFSCSSSIKEEQDRETVYNGAIQQIADSNPSKMAAAVVAATDGLEEESETCSIPIQTDDLLEGAETSSITDQRGGTSSIPILTDDLKEHAKTSSVADQTNGLLENTDCDGHEDESSYGDWDHTFDIGSNTYPDQDEDEDFPVDELPFDEQSDLVSEWSYSFDNNPLQNDDNHSMIQEDNQNDLENVKNMQESPIHAIVLPTILSEDDRDARGSDNIDKDQNQNRAVA
ncbi:Hypothetical protein CHV_a0370 [Cardinium endosymbiont cBtQ1 of Bemisia tabaci]|nr:Hypothetical protein CHV_a0370 [Cardinium endosymbiont cBtQ1 of Bemisia tabaci]